MTDKESFQNVKNWLEEIDQNAGNDVKKALVGNKCDLKNARVVDHESGKQLAEKLEIPFIETSALDSTNVNEAFTMMAYEIYKSGAVTSAPQETNFSTVQTKGGCCG